MSCLIRRWPLLLLLAFGACAYPRFHYVPGPNARPGDDKLAVLYEEECGTCHDPYAAYAYPANQWPEIFDRMVPETELDDQQAAAILEWLQRIE